MSDTGDRGSQQPSRSRPGSPSAVPCSAHSWRCSTSRSPIPALPYIEGGIGTGGVYGTWISTAYLIGEIIVIPMTDFLSRVFSLRRYLLAKTALFLLFSVLCGQAHSLGEMIVFRALQGFSGGVMIPLAFTIIIYDAAGARSRRWG